MTQTESSPNGGREASLARRRALSAGKGALVAVEPAHNGLSSNGVSAWSNGVPVPSVGNGLQSAPSASSPAAGTIDGRAASLARRQALSEGKGKPLAAQSNRDGNVSKVTAASFVSRSPNGGREASLARRRAVSAGKSALPPAAERVRDGQRSAGIPVASSSNGIPFSSATPPVASSPPAPPRISAATAAPSAPVEFATNATTNVSVSEQARARRAELSRRGQGAAVPSPSPSGAAPEAPLVVSAVAARDRQRVTGLQNPSRVPVTGEPREVTVRTAAPKVGFARTTGGLIVSGSLVRSNVPVTGDEPGASITITGEADQRPQDDLSVRDADRTGASRQFIGQAHPHGSSVFGFNFDRGARLPERRESLALESTLGGLSITGSAVGRSGRVTGDEAGACRKLTGDQYVAPDRSQAECGGSPGGSGIASRSGAQRRDPVTGAKVVVAETRGGQRVSGVDLERSLRVTSRAGGGDATVTGSQYSVGGRSPALGFAAPPLTGDVPLNDAAITGTARGATLAITGTAYYREQSPAEAPPPAGRVAMIAERFSVSSPQRTAQLRAPATTAAGSPDQRITGVFAAGADKVTGNLEFLFRPRLPERETTTARLLITGEGRANSRITGAAWTEQENVTGTEGTSTVGRNPSARAGKAQTFAGARRFATFADREEPKHLVTGMVGYSSDSAAKVTLSGGAQG